MKLELYLVYKFFAYNRNPNVLPYDHNIIKLKKPIRDCKYVNASRLNLNKGSLATFIKKSASRNVSFIVSQGPLPNTCIHHLQMIVEQGVDAVVMLTKLDEPRQRGNYLNIYVPLNVSTLKKLKFLPSIPLIFQTLI